jgi:hypothetical protein
VLGCAIAAVAARAVSPNRRGSARPAVTAATDADRAIGAAFQSALKAHQDLGYDGLLRELKVARRSTAAPRFDPTSVRYYQTIRKALALTPEEQAIFKRTGLVGVDHGQRYTMAGAYLAIYRRDLPVLITTDSILHAMHRSFDNVLMAMEYSLLAPALKKILAEMHSRLRADLSNHRGDEALRDNLADVDLYLTVARNLLAGTLAEADCRPILERDCPPPGEAWGAEVLGPEADLDANAKAKAVIRVILAAKEDATISLYGRRTSKEPTIDWTQFLPRGHYTKNVELSRYFRAMMWLGRVDVGFRLASADRAFGDADAARELRDATLLALLVRNARQEQELARIDRALTFLVGLSDNLTVANMVAAAERAGIRRAADVSSRDLPARLGAELRQAGGGAQRIRSQLGHRAPGGGPEIALPAVFQLLGQRFAIDSFVFSKVVFDSIEFKGMRPQRMMPTGLDLMAALGNDEAVVLLEPELKQWNYSANLLAARRAVADRPKPAWTATQYDLWLSALALLDDVPDGKAFPQVMRSQAWARKQLQTQLGSWAELRHDTILYAKQSYTMGVICEYPFGYVEPYPDFFARIAQFAELAGERLAPFTSDHTKDVAPFFKRFAEIVHTLERLARKELAGKPFAADEKQFIKETIDAKQAGGGCGGPSIIYTGWYPDLIYRGKADSWEPTVADVHTAGKTVLEVGVGNVDFVVAAIDNGGDRAAYVGPTYSYYEFESRERLTDPQWQARITAGKPPPRPEWVKVFQAKPKSRSLTPPK